MIIDIHAHYGQWLSSSRPDTPEGFSELLSRFQIDAAIVSSGRAIQYEIVSGNAEVAGLIEGDSRVHGAVVVNPNHYGTSLSELAKYRDNDRFVAAKLHPDYCGLPADSPESLAVVSRIAEIGLPLFLHTWGQAQVEASASVARKFPTMPVFMFHMGGPHWRLAIKRALELPNVYLEIISTVPEAFRVGEAVQALGPERVFFGTDLTLFTPAYALGLMDSAGLSEAERQRVMALNAQDFFGIPAAAERKPQ